MIGGIALLLSCELAGIALQANAHLPVPGPVIGMILLTLLLLVFRRPWPEPATNVVSGLERVAGGLISSMGLLFVPAGVGVIAQASLIRAQWLPIAAGLLGSTLLGLVVTALVMRWTTPSAEQRAPDPHGEASHPPSTRATGAPRKASRGTAAGVPKADLAKVA